MNKLKLVTIFLLSGIFSQAQSYLPLSGGTLTDNLKINGTDAAWAENLLLIKPSGWGGLRFSRRDPSIGNFDGNWAIGYNANSGNDFSISSNYLGTQYDYLFHISASTRNIGIGLSNPKYKVHVNGQLAASQVLGGNNVRNDGGMGGIDFFDNGIGYAYSAKLYTFKSDATGEYYGFTNDYDGNGAQLCLVSKNNGNTGNIGFYTGNGQKVMTIANTGNVGIGTTSPIEKLSVNGNIRSKKIIVTQQNWSDYVFDSSYQLCPLTELEQFIKTNRHLPEVSTAKEVLKDGIDVGENQALLLKKIEELTLYMILLKKENNEMKRNQEILVKKNEKLEKAVEQLNLKNKN